MTRQTRGVADCSDQGEQWGFSQGRNTCGNSPTLTERENFKVSAKFRADQRRVYAGIGFAA
ncbi:hypothetical protein SAMN05421881_10504 [Nitrosomonas halophila]|uniref:Uncharacterized protein n=1 Tax=Nitrosomonas halophila TaxID=44576 RepID=A0A1H3LKG4_9PROT|nr:hypothetical protein SAMN05421881_10504 [Nitrosomonas halophila]